MLGPDADVPAIEEVHALGAGFWTLAMTRELDDLILDLRTNETELGTWVLRTRGDAARVLAYDCLLLGNATADWLAGEIVLYLKRTLKRLDVTSRSLIALIEPGSCFAGSLLELALAADRSYMLLLPGGQSPSGAPGTPIPPVTPRMGGLRSPPYPLRPTVGVMNLCISGATPDTPPENPEDRCPWATA